MQDSSEFGDKQDQCRAVDCDGDPNSGDGWDGFCGTCADAQVPLDEDVDRQ